MRGDGGGSRCESIMMFGKRGMDKSGWIQIPIGNVTDVTMREYIESKCRLEEEMYPGEEIEYMFKLWEGALEVKESVVAEWAGEMIQGLFTKVKLTKGMVIGVYKGRRTVEENPYVIFLLKNGGKVKILIFTSQVNV